MAYKPTHRETKEYRNFDKLINKYAKKIRKQSEQEKQLINILLKIYPKKQSQLLYGNFDVIFECMHELLGTKRYTGETINLADQHKLYTLINDILKTFDNTEKYLKVNI